MGQRRQIVLLPRPSRECVGDCRRRSLAGRTARRLVIVNAVVDRRPLAGTREAPELASVHSEGGPGHRHRDSAQRLLGRWRRLAREGSCRATVTATFPAAIGSSSPPLHGQHPSLRLHGLVTRLRTDRGIQITAPFSTAAIAAARGRNVDDAPLPPAANPLLERVCGSGRYWARTSDPQLVELVLSQLS